MPNFITLSQKTRKLISIPTSPLKPFWLHTDASPYAVGGCLSQRAADGSECPQRSPAISSLPRTQTRWSTIEREAFGVIWGLKKFDFWLFGAQVTAVSDHNPLSLLA